MLTLAYMYVKFHASVDVNPDPFMLTALPCIHER